MGIREKLGKVFISGETPEKRKEKADYELQIAQLKMKRALLLQQLDKVNVEIEFLSRKL